MINLKVILLGVWDGLFAPLRRHPRAGKDIYRWIQLRDDMKPMWLIVGFYRNNGRPYYLDPIVDEMKWLDGVITPARYRHPRSDS